MSTENLKVIITGDASGLDKTSAGAQKALENISGTAQQMQKRLDDLIAKERSLLRATNNTFNPELLAKYNKALADVRAQMNPIAARLDQLQANTNKIVPAATHASSGFYGLSKSAKKANFAMISLSQGIGDLPYGFSAIANNAQQTFQAFTYLQRSTGSTKSALKALVGSLTGPSGMFLAFSVVTAAITYFSNRSRYSKKDIDEFKKSIQTLTDSIKTQGDAFASGLSDASKRITTLKLLYDATQNTTLAMNERLKAARELQKQEPKTFKAFSDQAIVVGKAASAYNQLTTNILKYAQAQGLANAISQNSQKQFDIQGKILDLSDKITSAKTKNSNAISQFNKSFEKLFPKSDLNDLNGRINKVNEFLRSPSNVNTSIQSGLINKSDVLALRSLSGQLAATGNDIKKWSDQINDLTGVYGKLFQKNEQLKNLLNPADFIGGIADGSKGGGEAIKGVSDILDDLAKKFKQIENEAVGLHYSLDKIASLKVDALTDSYKRLIALGISPANDQLQQMSKLIDALSLKPITPIGFQGINQTDLDKQFKQDQRAGGTDNPLVAAPPTEEWSKFFTDNQKDTENWMKAGRQLENVFDGIFTTLANGGNVFDALKQAVIQLITQLTAAAAAAAILAVFTGGGSAAFGSYFSALSGIPKFASGGFIPGPTLAVVGDAPGGEWVLNQKQMGALLNGAGNNKGVRVSGELRLRGNDLVAAIKRTNDSNSRVN